MRSVNPEQRPEPTGGYAHGIGVTGASDWLYVSGQTPEGPDGAVAADFASQCRQAWLNVEEVLHADGFALGDLVKVTTFLADRADRAENRAIRNEVLGDHAVALTVIIAGIFDEAWKVEIEAVAAR